MTVLATVIVLGVLIFVHELGHFWAAKAVGIEVQRFSIGLGPKVVGFQRGETEYIIAAIPLGGYVKMGGMDDEVMERIEGGEMDGPPREPSDRDFDSKPIWARTLVISAGVIMNMLFAFGVYVFLAANYGVQTYDSTRIGMVEAELLPAGAEALGTVEPGSRVVSIDGESVDDWAGLEDRFLEGPAGPAVISLVEPQREVRITVPEAREERIALASAVSVWLESGVGFLAPGDPADEAGLEVGDRILAVDGEPTLNWWTFVQQVEARPGERVQLTLNREGSEIFRNVTLDAVEEAGADGTVATVGRIGISPPGIAVTYNRVSFMDAVEIGYQETVAVTGLILGFLRDLVTLNVSPRSVGSIVTIGEASGQAAAAGLDTFLRFMALFSINLAVLNLLPIPVLDGGHLLFLAIEAIRGGRGLSVEQRLKWSNVGFLIIVGIMLWALSNDFLRLFGL
ncbi:MAG: RIP metalloprotease RseP [Longimicrobiales bacterium]|nr:RIP metalloprotease RseP [Longimicrobiales bacterium]